MGFIVVCSNSVICMAANFGLTNKFNKELIQIYMTHFFGPKKRENKYVKMEDFRILCLGVYLCK